MNFDGQTYDPRLDGVRLGKQLRSVRDYLASLPRDRLVTLRELSEALHYPEASISARIRDLRKDRWGGLTVERQRLDRGLWGYRLIGPRPPRQLSIWGGTDAR